MENMLFRSWIEFRSSLQRQGRREVKTKMGGMTSQQGCRTSAGWCLTNIVAGWRHDRHDGRMTSRPTRWPGDVATNMMAAVRHSQHGARVVSVRVSVRVTIKSKGSSRCSWMRPQLQAHRLVMRLEWGLRCTLGQVSRADSSAGTWVGVIGDCGISWYWGGGGGRELRIGLT